MESDRAAFDVDLTDCWPERPWEVDVEYSYSHNGEEFYGHCATIQDAIAVACDDDDMSEVIYVGESHKKTIGAYLWPSDIERLLEMLSEQASEECGECAESWLEGPIATRYIQGETHEDRNIRIKANQEKRKEWMQPLVDDIKAALEKWATENGEQPGFWHVQNVKEYDRDGNLLK